VGAGHSRSGKNENLGGQLNKSAKKSSQFPSFKRREWLYAGLVSIAFGLIPSMAFAQATPAEAQPTPTRLRATVAQPSIPVVPGRPVAEGDRYQILRYNEDWSFLKDPSQRTNFFDPLKFIPLNDSKDIYLTLFGDERLRNVNESTQNVKAKTSATNFLAVRTDFGADLHVTPYFRSFVELVSAYDLGNDFRIGGTRGLPAAFQNPLDLLQAFVEPMDQIGNVKVGLRVGREVMKWGNGTVIDPNDFPNVQTAFDAVHPYVQWNDWRLDGFVSDSVAMETHTFQDENDPEIKLDGLYGSKKYSHFNIFGTNAVGVVEPFFFNYLNNAGKYGSTLVGTDHREDFGLRVTANFGGFDFDDEGIIQSGTFANRKVQAWAYFSNQGYTFEGLPLQPRIGLQADGASGGGGDARTGTISTYQPMFPSALYLADMAFFSASNLIDARPTLTLHFTPTISLEGFYGFYWRQNTHDAIYSTAPFAAFGTTGATPPSGHLTAQVPQILFSWAITPQVLLTQYASVLVPAHSLRQEGAGDGDVFFASTLLLRF